MTEKLPRKYERLPAVSTMIAHLQAGLSVKDIATMYGVAETSVRSFCSRNGLSLVDLRNWKKVRADVVAIKQAQMIEAITPEKMASASLRDLVAGAVGLHGVERLERGQSTANVDFHELSGKVGELFEAENKLRRELGMEPLPDPTTPDSEPPST